jgi:NAD(P)-dependent dehydrogenase (short-subunit alcohol dehydrogenase family)
MTRRQRDLTGTVVAITGGARGIGAAIASALAAKGARVAIGDLDATGTELAANGIGHDVLGLQPDVTTSHPQRERWASPASRPTARQTRRRRT